MSDVLRTAAAMAEAVKILARDHSYDRALAVHHEGSGGRCASCGQRRPCTIASLAVAARGKAVQEAAEKAARNARIEARLSAALTPAEDTPDPRKPATEPIGEAS